MPELPEVETVARQLSPLLKGETLRAVKVIDPKLKSNFSSLKNSEIISVRRLGKQVVISCRGAKQSFLAVHLRMTGRLIWAAATGVKSQASTKYYQQAQDEEKHLRAKLICDGGELRFYDTRRFGTIVVSSKLADFIPAGIDPTCASFTQKKLTALLKGSKQPLKNWLLRQDRIVGLGNIYACEIMFAAKLNPFMPAGEIDAKQAARLFRHTKRIIQQAIENCGTTFSDFQQADGEIGEYQEFLKVYGRESEPCRRCKAPIIREVQGGRSTFYCPECQG